MTTTLPQSTAPRNATWISAVQHLAAQAATKLPQALHERLQKATALVLTDGVWLDEDETAMVRGSKPGTWWHVNGHCNCPDAQEKAPNGYCKHRLARGLYLRAGEVLRIGVAQPTAELEAATPHNPAPTEAPPIPPQHVVHIQGRPFVKFTGLLQMAHEHGLVALSAAWTYNDADLSLAHAVATFADGRRFEESGDATPGNTNKKVAVHFRRVALTRAKARVLRDALGVELVAVEELADE